MADKICRFSSMKPIAFGVCSLAFRYLDDTRSPRWHRTCSSVSLSQAVADVLSCKAIK